MIMLIRIARLAVVAMCAAIGLVAGHAAAAPTGGPNPVLVIGGYDADQTKLDSLRAWLGARGYSAYSMVLLGDPTGTAAIADSAQAVADKVAAIRRETGSARVDLAGHSMGGLAQRHYVKFLGGADHVGTYIDYGTPELGEPLGWLCGSRLPVPRPTQHRPRGSARTARLPFVHRRCWGRDEPVAGCDQQEHPVVLPWTAGHSRR
jgi:triacylglycerol esterase/lipase EstA (alpha/beta hydrolase family)